MREKKYTLTNDKDVELKIDKEVNLITQALRDILGNKVVSVWLIGGFGRGEGGVEKINHINQPKNNYDFLVVVNKRIISKKWRFGLIKKIEMMLAGIISVPIEMSFKSCKSIRSVDNIMIYRDIFNSSITLYGPTAVELLNISKAQDLPFIEALRVIRNRGMLLMASEGDLGHYGYIADEKQKMIWRAKSIIGYADAILIIKKEYVTSYAKKNEKIQELDLHDILNPFQASFFKKVMAEATEYRLFGKRESNLLFDPEVFKSLEKIHSYVFARLDYEAPATLRKLCNYVLKEGILKIIRNIVFNFKNLNMMKNPFLFMHPRDQLNFVVPYLFYKRPIPVKVQRELEHLGTPEKAIKGYVEYLV